jgi:hypothetical protein
MSDAVKIQIAIMIGSIASPICSMLGVVVLGFMNRQLKAAATDAAVKVEEVAAKQEVATHKVEEVATAQAQATQKVEEVRQALQDSTESGNAKLDAIANVGDKTYGAVNHHLANVLHELADVRRELANVTGSRVHIAAAELAEKRLLDHEDNQAKVDAQANRERHP